MNFGELKDEIWEALGETSTNSRFTAASMGRKLNACLKLICRLRPWLFLEKVETLTVTTTTITASSTGTALTVTSTDGLGNGRWIDVTDGASNYETVRIATIDSATGITLVSPGLSETYTSGYVTIHNNFFPYDMGRWVTAIETDTPSKLQIVRPTRIDSQIVRVKNIGTPSIIYPGGICFDREPLSGTNSADAGTSTTSVVDAALSARSDDYYNGWMFTNVTRSAVRRVTDYVASTKTLTLDSAVTSQASTDTYFLQPFARQFYLNPLCDETQYINMRFIKEPATLVNTYDVPELPETYHPVLIYRTLIMLLAADRNNKRAKTDINMFAALYKDIENQMWEDDSIIASTAVDTMATGDDDETDEI